MIAFVDWLAWKARVSRPDLAPGFWSFVAVESLMIGLCWLMFVCGKPGGYYGPADAFADWCDEHAVRRSRELQETIAQMVADGELEDDSDKEFQEACDPSDPSVVAEENVPAPKPLDVPDAVLTKHQASEWKPDGKERTWILNGREVRGRVVAGEDGVNRWVPSLTQPPPPPKTEPDESGVRELPEEPEPVEAVAELVEPHDVPADADYVMSPDTDPMILMLPPPVEEKPVKPKRQRKPRKRKANDDIPD